MPYFIGVDTGGTFTDVAALDGDGRLHYDKAFSTPRDPTVGVLAALERVASGLGVALEELLQRTERFCHGTTIATNALLERRGARVGLLTTAGFEDTLTIARGPLGRTGGLPPSRAMDFLHNEPPPPLVPRRLVRGVTERITRTGEVLVPLDADEARRATQELLAAGIEGLAICLLWSFRNDVHERLVADVAHELAPRLSVSCSADVSPLLGEFERALTTVINEYVRPITAGYIGRLQSLLAARGLRRPVEVMTCSGGLCPPEQVGRRAVAVVNSGPVGGLMATRHLAERLGWRQALATDMGGTSFDVGLFVAGTYEYDRTPFLGPGLPVQTPAVRVVTVGAGGGSIAWAAGRRLHVGPRSAGADPGPACYGRGGKEPTVTDALLLLGLLDPHTFFGGRRRLDPQAAREAVTRLAGPLALEPLAVARGIYEIVTARMADLVRKATVEAGHDPRRIPLIAYGGAGPAHAAAIGRSLRVPCVVIPFAGPVFSALGVALSDVRYAYARSEPMPLTTTASIARRYDAVFTVLEERARVDLAAWEGDVQPRLERLVDLRYAGQMNEVTIPAPPNAFDAAVATELASGFESVYRQRFGAASLRPGAPLELVSLRLEASVPRPSPAPVPPPAPARRAAAPGRRTVHLGAEGPLDAQVYEFDTLPTGLNVSGPAVIERRDTTIWVPPGHRASLDDGRNVLITYVQDAGYGA